MAFVEATEPSGNPGSGRLLDILSAPADYLQIRPPGGDAALPRYCIFFTFQVLHSYYIQTTQDVNY